MFAAYAAFFIVTTEQSADIDLPPALTSAVHLIQLLTD